MSTVKRTLLAIAVAVLISMMLVPDFQRVAHGQFRFAPFFLVEEILWGQFILEMIFLSVLAVVLVNVNIPWRRALQWLLRPGP
jgi:hypothetical protein